jgi:hypothetical protein
MVRLLSALSALLIAATVLWLSLHGVERLQPLIQSHMHSGRFDTALALLSAFFGAGIAIVLAVKEGRARRDEDVPLTPMVRRLPSDAREL